MTSVRFTFFHHPPHWDPCAASHLPVSLLPYGESSAQQPGLEVSGLSTILLVQLSSSTLSPFMASVACRVKIRACNSALRALCGCEPAHLSHLSPLMLPFLHELNHCTFSAPPWHVAVVHAVSCFSYNQCCYLHSSVLLSSTPPLVPGPYHVLFPLPGMLCIPRLAYDPHSACSRVPCLIRDWVKTPRITACSLAVFITTVVLRVSVWGLHCCLPPPWGQGLWLL